MSLGYLAVNMTPLLPSKSLHPGGEHGREIMKRNVLEKVPFRWVCPEARVQGKLPGRGGIC